MSFSRISRFYYLENYPDVVALVRGEVFAFYCNDVYGLRVEMDCLVNDSGSSFSERDRHVVMRHLVGEF